MERGYPRGFDGFTRKNINEARSMGKGKSAISRATTRIDGWRYLLLPPIGVEMIRTYGFLYLVASFQTL